MGLSKNITLTIKDYEIKLDKEIKFYENDTIDLCFSILEYGIEVKDGISINKLMPIQALRSYMLIETPHGIDYAESTKIEDNKIVFNLGTKYSQFVGIGRMQIVVKDSDGCRVTLPEFEFEIKESINMNWDRESFDFLATEDDSIIIDEFGRKIHMSKISDMPESENISEESYAMIIDEEGNKRFKVRAIADAVEHSLDAKFNAYTDEINSDVEEFKGSVRTDVTTLTNENNTFKNQVNTSLANYGSDYNSFKDNVEARLGEHMTDYNRFKDGVEARIEEGESTYDGFVSDVSTVLDNYGSTYNAFKSDVNKTNESFRNTLNASNQAFKNEMVDRYDNFIYKIDEDIFEGGRTDYFGETHEKIGERLDLDFDVVHQRINDSGLMEYEGCSIMANNTYYGRQKDTVINGRTLQNLVPMGLFESYKAENWNTLTEGYYSFNNGYLTLNYKENGYVNAYPNISNLFKANTVYTMVLDIKENTLVRDSGSVFRFSTGEAMELFTEKINAAQIKKGLNVFKLTTQSDLTNATCITRMFIYNDVTSGSVTFRYAIYEGDHTETPIEELPFIEGIESVGDKSKNLFNKDITENIIQGKFINGSGDYQESSGTLSVIQEVKPDTTYKISGYYNRNVVRFEDKDRNFISTVNATIITTPNNCKYMVCYIGTGDFNYQDVLDTFQIEEGTQATPYQEYYDGYKISGKSCGKNLVKSTVADMEHASNTYVRCEGTHTSRSSIIKLPKGKYSLSFEKFDFSELKDGGICIWDNTESTIWKRKNPTMKNFEILEDEVGITWYGSFSTKERKDEVVGSFIQIEEGTQVTPYEPYKESNYSYILNEPLRSLPNGVCDEIDLTTGVLTRRVGKVTFTGREIWGGSSVGTQIETKVFQVNYSGINSINLKASSYVMCEQLPSIHIFDEPNLEVECVGKTAAGTDNKGVYFRISCSKLESQDEIGFKKYLEKNNLTVWYELDIPTTEQLAPQQLKSFDVTTHIISDNKLMPVVSTKIPTDLGAMVNTLSLRNRELEEVNEQQDELIDITMMATDEMYSMLEPLVEAVEPMGLLDCSKMAQMYVAMVQRGIKKIEDVPRRYQEEVREVLGIKIEEEEWGEDDGIK